MKAVIGALFAGLVFSTVANAACLQSDLSGTWQIYTVGANSSQVWWTRCKVSVNGAGTMSNGSCSNSLGQTGAITSGNAKMTVGALCTFTAQFHLGGALNQVVHATLSRDKTTGSGVGTFSGGGFMLSMTKL